MILLDFFFFQSMTIAEAEEKLLTILKQVMEEKLTSSNVEVMYCTVIVKTELVCGGVG